MSKEYTDRDSKQLRWPYCEEEVCLSYYRWLPGDSDGESGDSV